MIFDFKYEDTPCKVCEKYTVLGGACRSCGLIQDSLKLDIKIVHKELKKKRID